MGDITQLSEREKMVRSKKQMMYFAIVSMVMMFAGLTSGYLVSRGRRDWVDVELPQEFYVSTAVIVLSSLTLFFAKRLMRQGKTQPAVSLTVATFLLGCIFVYMQFAGFENLYALKHYFTGRGSSVSASFIYIIVVAHLAHILAGLVVLTVLTVNALRGKYSREDHLGFDLGSIFWHFVDILWVFLLCFFILS